MTDIPDSRQVSRQAATHFYDRAEETRRQGDLPYAAKLEAIAERHFAEQTASCPKGDDR